MERQSKLEKKEMIAIFKELSLYYPNNPYKDYTKDELSIVIGMYYESLKYYSEKHIRMKMKKHIQKDKFFPKVCDLIPTESELIYA